MIRLNAFGCSWIFIDEKLTELYKTYSDGSIGIENIQMRQNFMRCGQLRWTAGRKGALV